MTSPQPADGERTIDLTVEVPGTPEEVWEAIATGRGITSWYVPHTVDERQGGAMSVSFGPGPEMTVPGRVAVWEPPKRVVFDGGEGVDGLAFEWTIEAVAGGSCTVRLVNWGFGSGEDWDAQYDGMADGWRMFLTNLRLHREHFAGRSATPMLPTAPWPGDRDRAWPQLTAALGIPAAPSVGDRIEVAADGAPELAGTVVETEDWRMAMVVDRPAPGTAFVSAEGRGETAEVSVWAYLYGPEAAAIAERDDPIWRRWLADAAQGTSGS